MVENALISRSFMVLCFGGAVLLLSTQRWSFAGNGRRVSSVTPMPVLALYAPSAKAITATDPVINHHSTALLVQNVVKNPRLIVDLSDRQVYLYDGDKLSARYAIAVAQPGWETPVGVFQVVQMQLNPIWRHPVTKEIVPSGDRNPLGSRWIGFWVNGEHQIGFHGTNQPDLIGQAVSHGCIRMRNTDIEQLYAQIRLNTPVTVRP
jgi:lipoprotein-anchoring transpeptidase ErfK/SrfK